MKKSGKKILKTLGVGVLALAGSATMVGCSDINISQDKVNEMVEVVDKVDTYIDQQKVLLEQQKQELEEQNALLLEQNAKLEESNTTLKAQNEALLSQNDILEDQLGEMEEENAILESQNIILTKQTQKIDEINKTLQTQKQILENDNASLEEQVAALKEINEALIGQSQAFVTQNDTLLAQNEILLSKLEKLEEQNKILQEQLAAETEKERRQIAFDKIKMASYKLMFNINGVRNNLKVDMVNESEMHDSPTTAQMLMFKNIYGYNVVRLYAENPNELSTDVVYQNGSVTYNYNHYKDDIYEISEKDKYEYDSHIETYLAESGVLQTFNFTNLLTADEIVELINNDDGSFKVSFISTDNLTDPDGGENIVANRYVEITVSADGFVSEIKTNAMDIAHTHDDYFLSKYCETITFEYNTIEEADMEEFISEARNYYSDEQIEAFITNADNNMINNVNGIRDNLQYIDKIVTSDGETIRGNAIYFNNEECKFFYQKEILSDGTTAKATYKSEDGELIVAEFDDNKNFIDFVYREANGNFEESIFVPTFADICELENIVTYKTLENGNIYVLAHLDNLEERDGEWCRYREIYEFEYSNDNKLLNIKLSFEILEKSTGWDSLEWEYAGRENYVEEITLSYGSVDEADVAEIAMKIEEARQNS